MISVSAIYDTVLALVRKDKRGLAFSPDDYNAVLPQVNQRVWRINYHAFESSKLSMDELGSLKIVDYSIALDGNGVGVLPTNYFHLAGDPWYNHATAGRRKIDLITTLEHGSREMDYLSKATLLYPTCFMGYNATGDDMAIHVNPTTCTPIYITYLRQTVTPFLDYYTKDDTLELFYLTEGQALAMPLGYTYRDETAGPANITSLTKDYEWHPHDEPQVIAQLLQAIGISFPDELLIQVGATNEIKVEKE